MESLKDSGRGDEGLIQSHNDSMRCSKFKDQNPILTIIWCAITLLAGRVRGDSGCAALSLLPPRGLHGASVPRGGEDGAERVSAPKKIESRI